MVLHTLYNDRNDCLIIGNGSKDSNVGIDKIKIILAQKNLKLENTSIDINAHGGRIGEKEKEHVIGLEENKITRTKNFLKQLNNLSNGPLNVHLWSCYGGAANKDIVALFISYGIGKGVRLYKYYHKCL